MAKVNIDALIPREDFETTGNNDSSRLIQSISITDLTGGFFYPFIRKPDFQRETSEWDKKKICDFIESFINGDLIPSIILWRSSGGYYFVIDGAHRLGALTAWIHDDYGDGEISQKFYDGNISVDQAKNAQETRKEVNKRIGPFKDIQQVPNNPNSDPEYIQRAKNIGVCAIQVQWVQGDATKAEHSFFKINQQGEPLSTAEIKLLESRKKGNAIAARAIIHAGKGYKFWANYSAENQTKIQTLSEEINKILFSPPLNIPVKTLDIPIAGKITAAQTLPLIIDFINIVNNLPNDFKDKLKDDIDGVETIKYLNKVRKIAWRINSIHPSSLGLHPIIYFYSSEGRHKTASFYAISAWIMEMELKNKFKEFINVREKFEMLLLDYDYLIQDINRKYRQAINSYIHIKDFYNECIFRLNKGLSNEDTINEIIQLQQFNYLKIDVSKNNIISSDFTTERKSAIFIKEALNNALKCKICNGLIHQNSITIDHINRKEDGGTGSIDNGQLAHPYCNTTYKN